jgi:hypothetical protein
MPNLRNPIFDRLPLRPDAVIDGIAVEYHREIIHPRFLDARSARYAAAGVPVRFEFSGMGDNPVTRAWQQKTAPMERLYTVPKLPKPKRRLSSGSSRARVAVPV